MASDNRISLRIGSGIGAWLPILFYVAAALCLMAIDARFSIGSEIRSRANVLVSPVWWLASQPQKLWQGGVAALSTNDSLQQRINVLEKEKFKTDLALQQMLAVQSENAQLRKLLMGRQRLAPTARVVELLNINPDASQKRFVISEGARQNVRVGQVLIDANGLVGQVAEVHPSSAVVIGVTDADHAVPVLVARSGFRSVLFGQGSDNRLSLANLTPSDDVKAGDILLTSGIGGGFPPGIPVGQVKAFRQDPSLTFISAQVQPFARPHYGRHLLLLEILPAAAPGPLPAVQTAVSDPVKGGKP
ncbi:rod shape-determining protein MreC [Arenimonas sp.]|uniref:rod shape-determining protein MreC n=1 Tax=Arenimonas sp. TaxID=1872635 RepID=UPI0037BF8170